MTLGNGRSVAAAGILWSGSVALFVLSSRFDWRWARWLGLFVVGGTYVGVHAVLGMRLVPALAFVSLLIVQAELRVLAVRFAPLFTASITSAERRRIAGAFGRALVRIAIAALLSVLIPLLAAELAAAGFVPLTSVVTAFLLSAALVAVVMLLALLPALEQGTRKRATSKGAKDN